MPALMTHDTAPDSKLGFIRSIDEMWMFKALELARQAEAKAEVPVGAVLVKEGLCAVSYTHLTLPTNREV